MKCKSKTKQFRWFVTVYLLVIAMVMPASTWAQKTITPVKPQGTGSAEAPYQITNAAELYWFAALVNGTLPDGKQSLYCQAILMNDIVVNEHLVESIQTDAKGNVTNGDSFISWTPIGVLDKDANFMGTFDGQNFTISGLYCNKPTGDYVGFFGVLGRMREENPGIVKNLGIIDSYFNGTNYVGSISGRSRGGTITNCYNTSPVNGKEYVGGICGAGDKDLINDEVTRFSKCLNVGSVNGQKFVGGICGWDNYGEINNCYNHGNIGINQKYSSETEKNFFGGVCGYKWSGAVTNCYSICSVSGGAYVGGVCGSNSLGSITGCYHKGKVTGGNYSGGVCGKKDTNEKTIITGCYYDNTLCKKKGIGNETGSKDVAGCATGKSLSELEAKTLCEKFGNHPFEHEGFCAICDEYEPARVVSETHHPELAGEYSGYYAIENAGQLYWFSKKKSSYNVVLVNDITVNKNVLDENGNLAGDGSNFRTWEPIDYDPHGYLSTFDGRQHTIRGLYVNDENRDYVGLFARVGSVGCIKYVNVADSYFKGKDYVGGLCGSSSKYVLFCSNVVTVVGRNYIGGLCGNLYDESEVRSCYNTGSVTGTGEKVGGICGENSVDQSFKTPGSRGFTNCYNTGSVQGGTLVGGICGNNAGPALNCYNIGSVKGTANVGAIFGQNTKEKESVQSCFYETKTGMPGGVDGADTEYAVGKSFEAFQSGEVYCLFATHWIGYVYGQRLGTDDYPWLNPKGTASDYPVYHGYDCGKDVLYYSNQPLQEEANQTHNYQSDGFCKYCSAHETVKKVSSDHHSELLNTHNGYYAIENAGQLYDFMERFHNSGNGKAVLTQDIVVNENVLVDGELNPNLKNPRIWGPVGKGWTAYSHTFDGNGHTISGLYYNDLNNAEEVGFYGKTYNTTIKNLGIIDSYFAGFQKVGGICGFAQEGLSVENCYFQGKVHNQAFAGGIIGYILFGNNKITNSYFSGSVTDNKHNCGSLIGYSEEGHYTIVNCYYDNTKSPIGAIYMNDKPGMAMGKATEKFVNGEVAYLLSQGCSIDETAYDGSIWGQQLGTDTYPQFRKSKVYLASNATNNCANTSFSCSAFSNTEGSYTLQITHDTPIYHEAVAATCKDGNVEYYECSYCHKTYEDEAMTKLIEDVVLKKHAHHDFGEDYVCTNCDYAMPVVSLGDTDITIGMTDDYESQYGYNLFKYVADGTGTLYVKAYGSADTEGALWTALGSDVEKSASNDNESTSETDFSLTYDVEEGKTYIIGVRQKSKVAISGNYILRLRGSWATTADREGLTPFFLVGDGTSKSPYELSDVSSLTWFANVVNGGNTMACAILTDDITFTGNFTAIGSLTKKNYSGTFDGKGHTVTVNQSGSADVALFGQIGACTIKNLKVKGTINTTQQYAAGIAMQKPYNIYATIENCVSDVVINSSVTGEGKHGGIIGYVQQGTLNIKNCAVTGAINGASTNACGGIIGKNDATVNISNTYVSANFTVSDENSNVAVNDGSNHATLTNCYFVHPLGGTIDGMTQVTEDDVASGKLCMKINNNTADGSKPFGQQLGTDKYPVPGSPDKVISAAIDNTTNKYWATYSSQTNATELCVPDGKELEVYNATVNKGVLRLNKRSDNKVAIDEGVLLKTDCAYLNAKTLDETVTKSVADNSLVATPDTKETIKADEGHVLYRLAYNKTSDQTGLGFYLGVATVDEVKHTDGSYINTTPGKAYLDVLKTDVVTSEGAAAYGFLFTEEETVTGIECVTISSVSGRGERNHEGIHDLTGRKVANPTKGLYIINNKKVVIK